MHEEIRERQQERQCQFRGFSILGARNCFGFMLDHLAFPAPCDWMASDRYVLRALSQKRLVQSTVDGNDLACRFAKPLAYEQKVRFRLVGWRDWRFG